MRKRLRKKLRVGEFQWFQFQATLQLRPGFRWDEFIAALANFMSDSWRHWSFGYGEPRGATEVKYLINVGTRHEAELRRLQMMQWLEGRQDVQLVTAGPVNYKARVFRFFRQRCRKNCG